jgi:hypothetical protein
MFKFYIDGTLYNDPVDWEDFTEVIEYDAEHSLIAFRYDNKLTFASEAYDYLLAKKNTDGFCYIADIVVKQKTTDTGIYEEIFTGKIILSDCKFHLNKCMVECSIEDNNYGSLVFNNKSIDLFIETPMKTKNGLPLSFTDATGYPQLTKSWYWFNPNGGGTAGGGLTMAHVYDVFKALVLYITDNEMEFKSELLDYTLPVVTEMDKAKYLCLVSGAALRIGAGGLISDQQFMNLNFAQVFKEVNRLYPLGISIEYNTSGKPILRIESFDSLKQSASVITINNIADMTEHINTEFLFATVSIGSPSAEYDSSIHSYVPTKEITHSIEQYYLTGQCNIDKDKDLKGEFICDTNIIEELVVSNTSNQNYDGNIFFIEADFVNSATVSARATPNYDNPAYFHYNDNLFNRYAMNRNPLGTNVAINSGFGADISNSSDGTDTTSLGVQSDIGAGSMPPVQTSSFHNVLFIIDNAAVFDGTNYTALIGGAYTFWIEQNVKALSITNRNYWVKVEVRRYDSGAVLLETDTRNYGPFTSIGFQPLAAPYKSFALNTGDYVTCYIQYSSQPIDYTIASSIEVACGWTGINQSDFRTGSTPNSSGFVANNSVLEYNANILEFDFPLPIKDYKAFKEDTRKAIICNIGGHDKTAWIRNITRKLATTETKFELISNIAQTS